MAVSGLGVAYTTAGLVLAWSGLKNEKIGDTLKSILRGQNPQGTPGSPPVFGVASGAGATTAATFPGPGSEGSPGPGGFYDQAQLEQLWTSNGGSASAARNAACHAMQESSGNPQAESSNPDGGTNVGLWQLDTKGKGAGWSVAQLMDPATNCRITIMATRNGRDWSAWSTPGC